MEDLMGTPVAERLSGSALVSNARKELMTQASTRKDGAARRQAQPPPTKAVCMLERLIVDVTADTYDRMLAWWGCVSIWASLRFDDHRGLTPVAIRDQLDGYTLTFSRTKTTGEDKVQCLRSGVVSKDAWLVEQDWFSIGWLLWGSLAPFGRDYFLCPPANTGGCAHQELQYSEYSARMRSMVASLTDEEGTPLDHDWAMFLTPHSFRAYLPTALEAIGAPRSTLSWLLSWKGHGGAGYSRAGKDKTLTIQTQVARILRNHLGRGDPVGEHGLLEKLRDHLRQREVSPEEIERILHALTAYPEAPIRELLWPAEAASSSTDLPATTSRPTDATPPNDAHQEPPHGYIISISAKKRVRRLHLMGACHRIPGLDYVDYEVAGDQCPSSDKYDDYCRHCWRGGTQPSAKTEEDEGSQESVATDSESSSSGSA
jgi:hypothetical protein